MPKFRVDLITGLPPVGYVIVEAPDPTKAKKVVQDMVDGLELASTDDRILYEDVFVAAMEVTVLTARPATAEESEEDVIGTAEPITIHDLAAHRGLKTQPDGSYTMGDINEVGLEMLGGCGRCNASIASYNAYPSKSGTWRCADCIGSDGFDTVEEANAAIFGGKRNGE